MMNPNLEALTEDEIVARLRSGEIDSEEAYASLYTKLYPFLLESARYYRHSDEDMVLDILAQLPGLLESYDEQVSLRDYMLRALKNRIIGYSRKVAREPRIVGIGSIQESEVIETTTIPSNDGETQLVHDLLENLTEKQRLIITASYFEGASIEEIAKMLHVSHDNVRWELFKARMKLQRVGAEKWPLRLAERRKQIRVCQ